MFLTLSPSINTWESRFYCFLISKALSDSVLKAPRANRRVTRDAGVFRLSAGPSEFKLPPFETLELDSKEKPDEKWMSARGQNRWHLRPGHGFLLSTCFSKEVWWFQNTTAYFSMLGDKTYATPKSSVVAQERYLQLSSTFFQMCLLHSRKETQHWFMFGWPSSYPSPIKVWLTRGHARCRRQAHSSPSRR